MLELSNSASLGPFVSMNPFVDGIVFEGDLPLTWRELPAEPDAAATERLLTANESLARAFMTLMDSHAIGHGEERAENSQELIRLEAKLDLLLDMVTRALTRQSDMPEPVRARLSARGLAWATANPPGVGSWVLVNLYLHPRYLQPLELAGRVLPGDAGQLAVMVAFHRVHEAVHDCIDKFIFRHHRRVVASQRSPES